MYSGDFYEKNTLGMENTRSSGIVECRMLFAGFWNRSSSVRTRSLVIVFAIVLLVAVVPARVVGQAPPTGTLWVTYVNATPTTTNTGDKLEIAFRVVYFCCDAYLGTVGNPADGIKTASFLIVSILTQQSKEYPDVPVFSNGNGEYRAEIQIAPDNPTGRLWVYVEGNSLHSSSCFCQADTSAESVGPPGNTASEQTYDTSDMSLIEIGQPPSPSPFEKLFQGNELLLVLLAAIVLLLLAISLLARRKGKPAK
jgi:hypothetical protein